jgi:hypothetical protein
MLIRPLASAAVVIALLAGCAGGNAGSSISTIPQSLSGAAAQSTAVKPDSTSHREIVFTIRAAKSIQIGNGNDFYSQQNDCMTSRILKSIKYFDYSIWTLSPGNTNGRCTVRFTDNVNGDKVVLTVINKSN